jgi:hypothetical protein
MFRTIPSGKLSKYSGREPPADIHLATTCGLTQSHYKDNVFFFGKYMQKNIRISRFHHKTVSNK